MSIMLNDFVSLPLPNILIALSILYCWPSRPTGSTCHVKLVCWRQQLGHRSTGHAASVGVISHSRVKWRHLFMHSSHVDTPHASGMHSAYLATQTCAHTLTRIPARTHTCARRRNFADHKKAKVYCLDKQISLCCI